MTNAKVPKAFPGKQWEIARPAEVGMDPVRLGQVEQWFDDALGDGKGRLVIVRSGRAVLEFYHHIDAAKKLPIASAAKSAYSNVLGILVNEGKPASADEPVIDYYPEMMDVVEGQGNKPGRYAFPANQGITFRHLICNVSGYMKPGEAPGKAFNYQTWGMNLLTHALAKMHGLYDVSDPEGLPGFGALIREKLAEPIGAAWEYSYTNPPFNDRLQRVARLDVFGYYTALHTTALDLARLGWLWCSWGNWAGRQVIPEAWLRETTQVAPDILANCPEDEWQYGHGIWTNAEGRLWPELPREAFGASGAGGHYMIVFPSQELVVVQNPGRDHAGVRGAMANPEMLGMVLEACHPE